MHDARRHGLCSAEVLRAPTSFFDISEERLYVCAGLRLLLKTATEPWNVDFWVASSVLRKACDTCIMFELLVRVPGVDGV
jgi:hypothetical protein